MNAPLLTGAREALARAIRSRDHLRRSPTAYGGAAGYKEWYHFAVRAPGLDLLVNYSLVDAINPRARRGAELARITCLARTDDGWFGDVHDCPAHGVRAAGGRVELAFGPDGVVFDGKVYHLRATVPAGRIDLDLTLLPQAFPSEANNVEVEDGPCINWTVVPRLSAQGRVRVSGRTFDFEDCPAYHDHNWGHFRWGRNFAWEWGYALPNDLRDPFNVALVRLTDRGHNTDLMQGLFVWKDGRQVRVFRDQEVQVVHEGLLRPERPFKIPAVMGLLSPGRVTDVPARYVLRAQGRGDWAEFEFTAHDLAQVIIPNDDDLGVTIINEVFGHLRFHGAINGEAFDKEGASVCEFLGS